VTAVLTPARTSNPVRHLLPLALIFLSVGLSSAMAAPFLTLFLTDAVQASPLQVTVFLVAAPLSSVLLSTLIGRLSDRRPIRHRLSPPRSPAPTARCSPR
jgi:SET family sugar efflux transporter-like MFS transporter